MKLAPEGWREMGLATLLCVGGAGLAGWYWGWPAGLPLLAVWAWVICFFRDPARRVDRRPVWFVLVAVMYMPLEVVFLKALPVAGSESVVKYTPGDLTS